MRIWIRSGRILVLSAALGVMGLGCDSPPANFVTEPAEEEALSADALPTSATGGDETSDTENEDSGLEGDAAQNGGQSSTENGDGSGLADDGKNLPTESSNGDGFELSFNSTQVAQGQLEFSLSGDYVDQTITMSRNDKVISQTQNQVVRKQYSETFDQGSQNSHSVEIFSQNGAAEGLLDILVVVDNSGSMSEEQQNLSTKLAPLLSSVGDSDWAIGVTTTDPSHGCLEAVIRKGDSNFQQNFHDAVQAGINGTGREQGFRQAVAGLKAECMGPWLRQQSTVAVLIVSDEDNCSDGNGCGSDPWSSPSYLTDYLAEIREVGVNARVYGLIWHSSQTHGQCNSAYNQGHSYSDIIASTGGSWGSICDIDYSGTLASISENLEIILKSQFNLSHIPVNGTLRVYVDDVEMAAGFSLNGKVLSFQNVPPASSTIRVEYDHTQTPLVSNFALSRAAELGSVKVYGDNQVISNAHYSYNPGSSTIEFAEAPSYNQLRVDYLELDGLQDEFSFNFEGLVDGSLRVTVNDSVVQDYSIDFETGVVGFQSAPVDGATINATFVKKGEPQLEYPILIPEDRMASLEILDQSNGEPIEHSFYSNKLVFPKSSFQLDRKVTVRYVDYADERDNIDPGKMLTGRGIEVSVNGVLCAEDRIFLSDGQLEFGDCLLSTEQEVSVVFEYVESHQVVFDLGKLATLPADEFEWEVFVNKSPVADFLIEDGQLKFSQLEYHSKVLVRAIKGSSL